MEGFHFSISAPLTEISLFGARIELSVTALYSCYVALALVLLALIFRLIAFPRFKERPTGFQNVIELLVSAARNYTVSIGSKELEGFGCYIFALMAYMLGCGLIELVGIRSPLTDLQQTAVLAVVSFVIINAYGFAKKGPMGRLRHFFPAYVAPIRIITEMAIPVSMACRLFGNMVGGLIIMELLYSVIAPIVPGVLSLYFTLFHVGMQTYIFVTLTLTFTHEAIE